MRKPRVTLPTAESKSGFTMAEAIVAGLVILLVVLVPVSEARKRNARASVAECQRYQARVAKCLWGEYAAAGEFPRDATAILTRTRGALPNAFEYKAIGDKRGAYYLRCRHDHSSVAVLYVDSGAQLEPQPVYTSATARSAMP